MFIGDPKSSISRIDTLKSEFFLHYLEHTNFFHLKLI